VTGRLGAFPREQMCVVRVDLPRDHAPVEAPSIGVMHGANDPAAPAQAEGLTDSELTVAAQSPNGTRPANWSKRQNRGARGRLPSDRLVTPGQPS
jgi:hypothetical protein